MAPIPKHFMYLYPLLYNSLTSSLSDSIFGPFELASIAQEKVGRIIGLFILSLSITVRRKCPGYARRRKVSDTQMRSEVIHFNQSN